MTEPRNIEYHSNVHLEKTHDGEASAKGSFEIMASRRTAYREECRREYGPDRSPKTMTSWALGCVAAIAVAGSAVAQTPVERGSYLVNGILTCGNCHTPRDPGGAWDMSKQLSGRPRTHPTAGLGA